MALTYVEIVEQVLDICGAGVNVERGRVKRVVNDVYGDVVQRILTPIKSVGPVTLTSGTGDYTLSAAPFSLTDFIALRTVIYNQSGQGINITLDRVSPHEIYQARQQTWSGFLWAYAIEGVDKLMLVPNPSTSDTLTLVYNYRPSPMAADSDTPTLLLDEDVDAIIVGAAFRVSRWKKPALAAQLEADFQRRVDSAQARQNRKGGAAGMRIRQGTRRRPPHDNSTDWAGWR